MTWKELVEQSLHYFKTHKQEFNWSIEDLDGRIGYLDDDLRHPMDDLNDYLFDVPVKRIMEMALLGSDDDSNSMFNTDRDYYYRNYWTGNLISTDHIDYTNYLDADFIEYLYEDYAKQRNWGRDADDVEEYEFPAPIADIFSQYYDEYGDKIKQGDD